MSPQPEISLFGSVELKLGDRELSLASKERALLAYLVMERHRAFTRDEMTALLWPQARAVAGRASLRQSLYQLRRTFADVEPVVIATRLDVRFNPASECWVDVHEFQRHLQRTQTHQHCGITVCHDCIAHLQAAAALYVDDFLAGLAPVGGEDFEEWRLLLGELLLRQVLACLTDLVTHFQRRRAHAEVFRYLEQKLRIAPWEEETHRQYILALVRSGRPADALRQFEVLETILSQQFGTAPADETVALREAIESGVGIHTDTIPQNPYRGLNAFRTEDAGHFHGRDVLIDHLVNAVHANAHAHALITLVGPSGSGRTSLIHAGLVPRLMDTPARGGGHEEWLIVDCRPGADPVQALASALSPLRCPGERGDAPALQPHDQPYDLHDMVSTVASRQPSPVRMLLIFDQFEEFYVEVEDATLRERLLDRLLALVNEPPPLLAGLVMLLSLRADFTADMLSYRPLADLVQTGGIVVGPMTRDELRHAIEEPAINYGAVFQEGLPERMLDDAAGQPGNLPALQFALAELWLRREHGVITHAAYDEIGGVPGAVAYHADQVYAGLAPSERASARTLFTRLVHLGEHADDTRRLVCREELNPAERRLAQKLADARLVVTGQAPAGGETVEIAHDALIRHWDRLRQWLDDDREFCLWQQRLRPQVQQWEQLGRAPDLLLHGILLSEAEAHMRNRESALSAAELAFFGASIAERDERRRQEAARHERELATANALAEAEQHRADLVTRHARSLGVVMLSLSLALVAAVVAGLYAYQQWTAATQAGGALGQSYNLTASAQLALNDDDTDLGLALALAANQIDRPPPQAQLMLATAAYRPGTRLVLRGHAGPVQDVAITADGALALSAGADGKLLRWDLATATVSRSLLEGPVPMGAVAIGPDGDLALSGAADGSIRRYRGAHDTGRGGATDPEAGHAGEVTGVAFSEDGLLGLSVSTDRWVVLRDLADGAARVGRNAIAVPPLARSRGVGRSFWRLTGGSAIGAGDGMADRPV